MLAAEDFFELSKWAHPQLFREGEPVWLALTRLNSYLAEALHPNIQEIHRLGPMLRETVVLHQAKLITQGFELRPGDPTKGNHQVIQDGEVLEGATVFYAGAYIMSDDIAVGPGSVVEPGALIKGPTIIGENCEIRQGAYVRGQCLVGDRCVVGHTTEVKHSVMVDDSKAGHFAYIGDSILGNRTNLGAGTKLANLKITGTQVNIKVEGKIHDTGLRKLGAVIGDDTETGCNSVTNPGTLLARRCRVCPAVSVKSGYYKEGTLIS
jgi:bifunctional N-acetylglucosamine-1-phosphate-uridyltransferase/glucosamine-1-phosphate-acetyltransferase GlmU-like protein